MCLNLNNPAYFERINNENKMLAIRMQRGSENEIYFCEETQTTTHQVCMLTFKKEAVTVSEIYRAGNASILKI